VLVQVRQLTVVLTEKAGRLALDALAVQRERLVCGLGVSRTYHRVIRMA
jgi:hypothetical protein